MQKKIEQKSFVFTIIVSELVALIYLYEEENTFIGSQCVKKQSEGFA